ncbi:MAG: hypothetical protein GWO39_04350 [Gammaproteobacteria bacterium]|nr:hypothetical protein [Gammaproteobacteria bacterium]NIT63039.1 hypothetical protein [Gammaproteobacteria bacterium]NIY31619.1 hypothetical protein [Gammaproteobacteria bacterium]
MEVELVCDGDCPNIEAARVNLLHAFREAGVTPHWREWERNKPETPAHARGFGSPTILVNGRDVSGAAGDDGDAACRVYADGSGTYSGAPPIHDIVRALESAQARTSAPRALAPWRLNGAALPAVGVAFLPKLACPACWPAYAGLLSTLGIGFFDYTPYLLPLTVVFLAIAVGALAYRVPQRHGYKPLGLGVLAAAALLLGKFHYDSDATMYAALAVLIGASLWNTWPRPTAAVSCCTSSDSGGMQ